jgi:hypothetical protein
MRGTTTPIKMVITKEAIKATATIGAMTIIVVEETKEAIVIIRTITAATTIPTTEVEMETTTDESSQPIHALCLDMVTIHGVNADPIDTALQTKTNLETMETIMETTKTEETINLEEIQTPMKPITEATLAMAITIRNKENNTSLKMYPLKKIQSPFSSITTFKRI